MISNFLRGTSLSFKTVLQKKLYPFQAAAKSKLRAIERQYFFTHHVSLGI